MSPSLRRLIPAVLWTVLIAALLTVPGSYVPGAAWSFDKIGHFGMFAGFGFLWVWALAPSARHPFIWVGLAGVAYAIGSEIGQSMMGGLRTGDPWDALANLLGLAGGLLFAAAWQRWADRRTSSSAA